MSPDKLLSEILTVLDDDKAIDVVSISLAGKISFADHMVIATGMSSRHIGSMAQHLAEHLKTLGISGIRPEGARQGDWVLLDAGDVIVHLFRPEIRSFYNLEKIWGADAPAGEQTAEA